jgi:hypothetical protein
MVQYVPDDETMIIGISWNSLEELEARGAGGVKHAELHLFR